MNNNTVELIKIGGLALGSILLGYITKKLYDRKSTKSSDHFFVGIDLGATNAKAGVVNDKGELLATASHPLTDYTDKGVVKALVEVASEAAGVLLSVAGVVPAVSVLEPQPVTIVAAIAVVSVNAVKIFAVFFINASHSCSMPVFYWHEQF